MTFVNLNQYSILLTIDVVHVHSKLPATSIATPMVVEFINNEMEKIANKSKHFVFSS